MNSFDGFYKKLNIKVLLLGKQSEGEGIIIILKCDDKVKHTMVIDSLVEKNGATPMINALQAEGVDFIDELVWTHPHDDHAKGLSALLDEYVGRIGEIRLPAHCNTFTEDYTDLSKSLMQKINDLGSVTLKKINNRTRVSDISLNTYIVDREEINIMQGMAKKTYTFNVYAISPDSNLVKNREISGKCSSPNDLSIALYYIVDDFVMFLGGDIENTAIYQLPKRVKEKMLVPSVLKIPHHASEGSEMLLELYDSKCKEGHSPMTCAATTAYKASSLPSEKLLDKYNNISDSVYKIDTSGEGDELAVLGFDVDILEGTITLISDKNYVKHISPNTQQ